MQLQSVQMTKLEGNIPTKWSASVGLSSSKSYLNNLSNCPLLVPQTRCLIPILSYGLSFRFPPLVEVSASASKRMHSDGRGTAFSQCPNPQPPPSRGFLSRVEKQGHIFFPQTPSSSSSAHQFSPQRGHSQQRPLGPLNRRHGFRNTRHLRALSPALVVAFPHPPRRSEFRALLLPQQAFWTPARGRRRQRRGTQHV
jgi:hypothetical protein